MKRAFTLIELLAVIVILTILVLVVSPLITGVIKEARAKTDYVSVEQVLKAAELYYTSNKASDTVTIKKDRNVFNELNVSYKKSMTGMVFVSPTGNIKMTILYNDKCYTKLFSEDDIVLESDLTACGEITTTPTDPNYIAPTPEYCFDTQTNGQVVNLDEFQVVNSSSCKVLFTFLSSNSTEVEDFCEGEGTINGLSVKSFVAGVFSATDSILGGTLSLANNILTSDAFTGINYVDNVEITDFKCYVGNTNNYDSVTEINVPAEVNEKKIYTIADGAFKDKNLTNIKINDGVQTINAEAFKGNKLTKVSLPESVTKIGSYAFDGNKISDLKLNDGLLTISDNAFKDNSLTTLSLPSSVTTLGSSAFANNQISELNLDDNLTKIGSWTFLKNKISTLSIPESVTDIGAGAFNNNELTGSAAYITTTDSLGSKTIVSYGGKDKSLVVTGYSKIGDNAFSNCDLTSVEIKGDVTSIGANAFSYNQLTNVIINSGVYTIGNMAFYRNAQSNPNMNKIIYKYSLLSPQFNWNDIITGLPLSKGWTATVITANGTTTVAAS